MTTSQYDLNDLAQQVYDHGLEHIRAICEVPRISDAIAAIANAPQASHFLGPLVGRLRELAPSPAALTVEKTESEDEEDDI